MEKTKKNHQWFQWLSLIISEPFYLYHFLIFFSYLVLRSSAAQIFTPHFADRLLHREIQAFLALSVLMAIKLVKEETWEAFVADALFFAKAFLIVVTLLMDYQLALCYMVVFFVVFILTQQPAYHELGTSCRLTPLQLEVLLTEGSTSRFWLVEFRALYSSNCIRTSRFFPELSITYSNKNLSFGIVDLGLFPNAAEKFGIALGGNDSNDHSFVLDIVIIIIWLIMSHMHNMSIVSMGQLPTYILFENGVEISRLPGLELETRSHPPITKRLLCQHFELDRHLIEYIHIK